MRALPVRRLQAVHWEGSARGPRGSTHPQHQVGCLTIVAAPVIMLATFIVIAAIRPAAATRSGGGVHSLEWRQWRRQSTCHAAAAWGLRKLHLAAMRLLDADGSRREQCAARKGSLSCKQRPHTVPRGLITPLDDAQAHSPLVQLVGPHAQPRRAGARRQALGGCQRRCAPQAAPGMA